MLRFNTKHKIAYLILVKNDLNLIVTEYEIPEKWLNHTIPIIYLTKKRKHGLALFISFNACEYCLGSIRTCPSFSVPYRQNTPHIHQYTLNRRM